MATPLLMTKLYMPPTRPSLVARPHLLDLLDSGLHHRLILISAPPGFGKTTLISTWLGSRGLTAAWISLDEGDNDPARFLAYLVAGLRTCHPQIAQGVLSGLQSPQPPATEDVLAELINEIDELGQDLIVVLDDYHLILEKPVHDAVSFLLGHLPARMVLVIATRGDPPLALARLRGRGQLTELRQADLRFTAEEAAEFLRQVMTVTLSAEDISALTSRTEGWVTGLQMAALALRPLSEQGQGSDLGEPDSSQPSAFVQAFTGSNRYILDYLVEEVLQRQPEQIQDFLLKSAILERLCGPLCDAILQDREPSEAGYPQERAISLQQPWSASQRILEQLESDNLFIIPLDGERRWYRYHRLFADLLRKQLQQIQPQTIPGLHHRASQWYEQQGLMNEAIQHALAEPDLKRAAVLMEEEAESVLMRSEFATFFRWLDALPDALIREHPSLCLYHALALLWSGQPVSAIESRLQDLDTDSDLPASRMDAVHASLAIWQGRASRASSLAKAALEQLPGQESLLRGVAAWTLGLAYMLGGEIDAGMRAFEQVASTARQTGNVMLAVTALSHIAEQHMSGGQLKQAQQIYEQALELATDDHGQRLPIAGMPLIGLGDIERERSDLDSAETKLLEGIQRVQEWAAFGALDGHIALARVKQIRGDTEGAQESMQAARQIAREFDITELDDHLVDLHQTHLWILQGNLPAIRQWLEERGLLAAAVRGSVASDPVARLEAGEYLTGRIRSYEYLLLAKYLLAEDRAAEALPLLESQIEWERTERGGRSRRLIGVLAQIALGYRSLGQIDKALGYLQEALDLAEPAGFVRLFLDEGEPMVGLLREAASRGIRPAYVASLLAAQEPMIATHHRSIQQPGTREWTTQPLVDPLTDRELDVLRLLAAGLSNPEIGEQLYIATSTVRSHLKSIYGKLDVHRRWDAVHRAQDLGLI